MAYFFSLLEKLATLWISRSVHSTRERNGKKNTHAPTVVITGGGSGIGFALAEEFSARGDTVVLIGRQEGRLKSAARDLNHKYGNRVLSLAVDVGQSSAVEIIERWLSLEGLYCDVLVNNAGIGLSGSFAASDIKDLEQLLAVNTKSLTLLTRAFLPPMIQRGRGGIINIGSLGGAVPGPFQAVYYASKAYVLSFTEAIASEISGQGVRLCIVLPGPVETRFHARMGAEGARYRRFMLGTTPEKVARLTLRGYLLGRRVIAPGCVTTAGYFLLRWIPHFLAVPVTKWLLSTEPTMEEEKS